MMKIILILLSIFAALIAVITVLYLVQSKSRKRFIKHTVRQVPYLIGRYFA